MIIFGKTSICVLSERSVEMSCDVLFSFENIDSEEIQYGTPVYWDEAIQSIYDSSYIICEIYKKVKLRNECNRVTDYKGVWGLLELSRGDFSARIECGEKVAYLGLLKGDVSKLKKSITDICFLLPADNKEKIGQIWDFFIDLCRKRNSIDFSEIFSEIVKKYPEIVCLHYKSGEKAVLTITCTSPWKVKEQLEQIAIPTIVEPHFRELLI